MTENSFFLLLIRYTNLLCDIFGQGIPICKNVFESIQNNQSDSHFFRETSFQFPIASILSNKYCTIVQ